MGFNLVNSENDADYTGKLKTFFAPATHATLLAPGDVVVISGTQNANGLPEADAAAAGAAFTGVIASIETDFEGDLTETGAPASTAAKLRCSVDQNAVYRVAVENGPLVLADVGLNADIVANVATKSGGLTVSNMTLDASTKATTQTLQFRIVGVEEDSAGALNVALVRPNNTTANDGAAGV